MSRIAYFSRETLISLRRNLGMTLAGIITVMISLVLAGGILLVQRAASHATDRWKHGVELEIFMKTNASQQQIDDVAAALAANKDQIKSFRFLNHDDAYKEFKKIFTDQPALVESTTPQVLPESYRVVPVTAELTEQVATQFQDKPGVDTVVTAQQQIKNILSGIRIVRLIFEGMAILLLAAATFLIVNTIRLATFARRREIEVMKLVGASNWFIRVPFMAEGMVQGIIGAAFAVGGVYALKVLITNVWSSHQGLFQSVYVTNADAVSIGILVLIVGAVIGALGSVIGLYRFLDH